MKKAANKKQKPAPSRRTAYQKQKPATLRRLRRGYKA